MSKSILLEYYDPAKTAFLACDIQEDFRKGMRYFDKLVRVAKRVADTSKILGVPLYVSEHRGFGKSADDFAKDSATFVYEKTTFSMHNAALKKALDERFRGDLKAVVLFGVETHICVEQTAMDFLRDNVAVHVLADGCMSRSQQDRIVALQNLRDIGCHVTTSESALLKLVKDDQHPKYPEILRIVDPLIPDTLYN